MENITKELFKWMYSKDTKEILHITNGKFDLEYHEVSNRKQMAKKKK